MNDGEQDFCYLTKDDIKAGLGFVGLICLVLIGAYVALFVKY